MRQKIILTRGLPAAGKDTWAKELILQHPNQYKRINKDMLREMLDINIWNKDNEKFILLSRNLMAEEIIKSGKSVIISDTNLAEKHQAFFSDLAKKYNIPLEIKDFTNITPEVCIERDLKRPNSVGAKVIWDMYHQFINPVKPMERKLDPVVYDEHLPYCWLIDIDGCLAKMHNRGPFDWQKVGDDLPNVSVINLVRSLHSSGYIINIMSGRDGSCREQTQDWLNAHDVPHDNLFMRDAGNSEKDSIIKERIFHEKIEGKYNIVGVVDDRKQVKKCG